MRLRCESQTEFIRSESADAANDNCDQTTFACRESADTEMNPIEIDVQYVHSR